MTQAHSIQSFISATEQIEHIQSNVEQHVQHMQDWQDQFAIAIQAQLLQHKGLSPESLIAQQIIQINHQLEQQLTTWHSELEQLQPAQSLAEHFQDKVMLLIFGKFNAGKSSLCNVLADCFRLQQQKVEYFYLDAGQLHYSLEPLKEGATETTARLQGVCLGEKLILLDTPGLHSVTPENAALTQQFIDSADGVLWLSSSSSPGQVKELEVLGQELRRHKPLLPVITRSDQLEEDEVDGDICQVLCNKSTAQRNAQEQDVQERSIAKLIDMEIEPSLLRSPVSISAQMLKQANFADAAMQSAGFNDLFHALFELMQPILMYKQRKSAEILLHHLQEQVMTPLQNDMSNQLQQLHDAIEQAKNQLILNKEKIVNQTWRVIVPTLPSLLEQYAPQQDLSAVCCNLHQQTEQTLQQQVHQHLAEYQFTVPTLPIFTLANHVNYEVIYTDDQQQEILTIGHDHLYREISHSLSQLLNQYGEDLILQCQQRLITTQEQIVKLQQCFAQYDQHLHDIAQHLRNIN